MSRSTSRRPALWATTAMLGALGVTAAAAAVTLPDGGDTGAARAGALAAPVPVVTSPNVSLVTTVPETDAISLEFARTGDFAYVSSLDSISVLDTSDPLAPKITGTVVNALFENEAMTYGERRDAEGNLTRFVLAGIDLYQADASGNRRIGGNEFLVVDVTDPTNPFIRSRTRTTTSTHTLQCVSQEQCDTAYSAGTGGKFSVLDLTNLDQPVELGTVGSPAAGGNPVFSGGAGHYWDFDGVYGWHTGSGGATVFDVTDPKAPVAVNGTDENGRTAGWNDFILHNSMRPNADVALEGVEPSVFNGNTLLVTEEDYFNDGDEVVCSETGSFQTWHVPTNEVEGYAESGVDTGNITPLDRVTPADLGGGLTTPAAAFCSAHWFDYHQDGFVAGGYYGSGTRILDVKDPNAIAQVGYATTAATQVWDAYWVPVRDEAGVATGEKTNIVYSVDATRGVDVYDVTLPELTAEQAAAKTAMQERRAALQTAPENKPAVADRGRPTKKVKAGRG